MKLAVVGTAVLLATAGANAQDANLPGLSTPLVLGKGRSDLGLQINAFGGADKLFRTGISYAAGLGRGWEASLAGTFAKESSVQLGNGGDVDYGGSAADLFLKYRIPSSIDASLEGGLSYSHTPAQLSRLVGLLGGSVGFSLARGIRVYANPKWMSLEDNSLAAIGLGAVADVTRRVRAFGEWTPLLSGENAISVIDGSRERAALYAVGLRFADVLRNVSVDVAYTNVIGETFGFSLTPSFGNTGGLYIGLAYRR